MFKRIKVSLTEPKLISQFLQDKKRVVFGYLLLLLLVAMMPTIIFSIVNKQMTPSFKEGIIRNLKKIDEDLFIEDYKLQQTIEFDAVELDQLSSFGINLDRNLDNSQSLGLADLKVHVYNFTEDAIELYFAFTLINKYSYEELDLNNVNLSNLTKTEETILLQIFDDIYVKNKNVLETIYVFSNYSGEFLLLLLLIAFSVFIYKYRSPVIKRKYRFVLVSYSYSIYLLSILLSGLFSMSFIKLIGIFMSILYLRKAYDHLLFVTQTIVKEDKVE